MTSVHCLRAANPDTGPPTLVTLCFSGEVFRLCCAVREKFPAAGSRQIKETLVAEGVPGAEAIAASTLRRWLREEHLPRKGHKT